MNMRAWSLLVAFLLVVASPVAWGQSKADNNPPEILTSDLALKTVLEHERVNATFVIVDTDNVVGVTIDGVKQKITPSDTVEVTHTFNFTKDVTQVVVTATDEHGHTRKVTYTAYKPGVNPAAVAGPKKAKLQWYAAYDVRMETDTNPSNDLSSPITIQGINLTGVVPDSQQTDTRQYIVASGGVAGQNWSAFAGASKVSYSKANNKPFNTQQIFFGGVGLLPLGKTTALQLGYTFTDVNLGSHDYDQMHTISPGLRIVSTGQDYTGTTLLAVDLTMKKFASSLQTNTTDQTLKWTYNSSSKDGGARYDRLFAVGKSSEGIDTTQYSFLAMSWDWRNRWDSGVLFNIGMGLDYRSYPNDQPLSTDTPLGNKRVDIPGRFSFGLGYQFLPQVRLMGRYRYLVNLSNKSPYVRQIYGIGVDGTF